MEKITIPYLKLIEKFRKSNRIVDVGGTLSKARSILVLMPDKLEEFGIARKFINQFIEDFPKAEFQFVLREGYQNLLNGNRQYGTIFVAERDVNFFGLPKKVLKQKILAAKCDIVIDLNEEFHLLSTYLCQKCRALLQICLDHDNREPFYNFYFRTQIQDSLESKYRKLFQYLNNCMNLSSENIDI